MAGQRVRGDARREVHHGVLCAQLLRHHGQQGRVHHPHRRGHDAQVHHLWRWAGEAKLCSLLGFCFFSIVGDPWHFGSYADPEPDPYLWLTEPDADPGGPKTYGSGSDADKVHGYDTSTFTSFFKDKKSWRTVLRIRIRDPVPSWPLDPGSGMGRKSASGSGMNNPDHIF